MTLRQRLLPALGALFLAGCSATSVGVGVGGGGFGVGVGTTVSEGRRVSPQVYRRMELSNETCCPSDTVLVPPFRGAVGLQCLFDTTYVSDDGRMRACRYDIEYEEASAAMVLCVDGELVEGTLFVRPVAWEPDGGRLLVYESAADDDLKMFVLNVAEGQYVKSGEERLATRIGRRADSYRGWAGDTLLVENHFEPGIVRRVAIPDARGD